MYHSHWQSCGAAYGSISKISRIDRLPYFPTRGAPRARLRRAVRQKALDPATNMATMEVCSPYKTVPQSMINSVLAVCPNVDPKNVAKDLVITGSATRTINRILHGQVGIKTNTFTAGWSDRRKKFMTRSLSH